MTNPRPDSIAEVARRADTHEAFHMAFKDFLHELRVHADPESIREMPALLAGKMEDGQKFDAYLAASALFLARKYDWEPPDWVYHQNRFLRRPWFLMEGPKIRNLLIMESPPEFRERNIFVSENALEAV